MKATDDYQSAAVNNQACNLNEMAQIYRDKESDKKHNKLKDYNPRLGIPYVLMNQLFFCVSRTCAKYIFERYPDMSPFQFLLIRAMVAFAFNLIMLNVSFKRVVWDSIGKENRSNLVAKVSTGMISVTLSFSAIKYFPLTYCTALRNLSPFFALLFSALCLAEPATCKQAGMLTLVVSLSIAFVFSGSGADGSQQSLEERADPGFETIYAWSCLLMTPVFLAMGSALNRALRKLDEKTVSTYSNMF